MTTAWVFGGQGTEAPRMGLALAELVPAVADLLAHAGRIAGVDPDHALGRGGPEFSRTSVVQPLLVAVALGVCAELGRAGREPDVVAGHSLGEVAAWSAAGCIGREDAVALAGVRGRLMEREATRHPGRMLALHGLDDRTLHDALELGRRHGTAVVAAHNAPGEWTVSGDDAALVAVAARYPSSRLGVQGAWHSPAMAAAVDELRAAARGVHNAGGPVHLVANRTGQIARSEDDPAELLAGQLIRPIEWVTTMTTFATLGVTRVVTIGPGKMMRSLLRKNLGAHVAILATDSPAELCATRTELAA